MNNLTKLFLDHAKDMAEEKNITMQKSIDITDRLLEFREKKILKILEKFHLIRILK